MNKKIIIAITVIAVIIFAAIAIVHFFKYISYPRDRDGMVNPKEYEVTDVDEISIALDENSSTGFELK